MIRLYPRFDLAVWLGLTSVGTSVSALSLYEISAGISAVRRIALNRPHAEDIISMAEHNRWSEVGRLVAQSLFMCIGVVAMFSPKRRIVGGETAIDKILPWIIVAVEGILVGNSLNEYALSRRVLRKRVTTQREASSTDPHRARR